MVSEGSEPDDCGQGSVITYVVCRLAVVVLTTVGDDNRFYRVMPVGVQVDVTGCA